MDCHGKINFLRLISQGNRFPKKNLLYRGGDFRLLLNLFVASKMRWLIVDGWKPTHLCFRGLSVLSEKISFVSTYRIPQIHHSILFYINTTRQQTNKNCLVSSLNLQIFVKEGETEQKIQVTHCYPSYCSGSAIKYSSGIKH